MVRLVEIIIDQKQALFDQIIDNSAAELLDQYFELKEITNDFGLTVYERFTPDQANELMEPFAALAPRIRQVFNAGSQPITMLDYIMRYLNDN